MVDGAGLAAYECLDLLIALHRATREYLDAAIRIERLAGQHLARRLHAFHHRVHIVRMGQIIRFDQRIGGRVRALESDVAAALRSQVAHVQRVAMTEHGERRARQITAVLVQMRRREMKLQIGNRLARVALHETATLRRIGRERARSMQQIAEQVFGLRQQITE